MNDELDILDPELANAIISGDVSRLHNAMKAMLVRDGVQPPQDGDVEGLHNAMLNTGFDIKTLDRSAFMPASKEEPKKLTRETAVTLAVKSESPEMLAEVTAAGANIHLTNSEGHTPISIAACRNLPGAIRALCIKGADISEATTGFKSDSPLGWAVKNDSSGAAAELLNLGANTEGANPGGHTPLSVSMIKSRSGEMTELLLSFGADPNKTDKRGYSPMHAAALDTDVSPAALALLLDAGARDSQDRDGLTAVEIARSRGNDAALGVFTSHPSLIEPKEVEVAIDPEEVKAVSSRMIDAVKTGDMQRLRNECAHYRMEPQKDEALSPLFAAVEARNAPAIRLLATLGMGTADRDSLGNTPLHRFVERMDQSSHRGIATLQHLTRNSYLQTPNSAGITPEMRARDLGKFNAVATLLSHEGMPATKESRDGDEDEETREKSRAPLAEGTEPDAVRYDLRPGFSIVGI
jgi:ankyrin repeat protein